MICRLTSGFAQTQPTAFAEWKIVSLLVDPYIYTIEISS